MTFETRTRLCKLGLLRRSPHSTRPDAADQPSARRRMRLCLVIVVAILMSQPGCQIFRRFGSQPATIPAAYEKPPSRNTLLADLNSRAVRVKQLSSNVTLSIPGSPKIKGSVQLQFPNQMRLKAGLLGVSEMGIDAGSNDQEFWVWSKMDLPNQPAAMYFARHRDYQTSQLRNQLPIDPRWLIQSLGIMSLDPADQHLGPYPDADGRMKLYSISNRNGQQETRVMLIRVADGMVEQIAVYDAENHLLAYANATRFRHYEQYNVSLPQRVELHMIQPDQTDVEMIADFGSFSINSLFGDPDQMWAMPEAPGAPRYDLGR